jgi:hypothetical protein
MPGTLNDINVLNRSPLFARLVKGDAPTCNCKVMNNEYTMVYYLTMVFTLTITTRKRLIAALLTAGKYDLKMPAVRPLRPASHYRRRVRLGVPGIDRLPLAKRASKCRGYVGSRAAEWAFRYRRRIWLGGAGVKPTTIGELGPSAGGISPQFLLRATASRLVVVRWSSCGLDGRYPRFSRSLPRKLISSTNFLFPR